jgi:hypothetical protein
MKGPGKLTLYQREPCIKTTWPIMKGGYGRKNLGGKITLAHRHAWVLVNGLIPRGLFVLHKCDNPACINTEHLFLGTQDDNMQDMIRKGRHKSGDNRGTNNPHVKITEANVIEIRRISKDSHISRKELGQKFGITPAQTGRIINRTSWTYLEEE